mmetsp:Transcript_33494/g.32954  ORF Transcript_33494/g.32954 Transcript_33494/m.32954 type:complete len:100 (+) Transcript_33494:507-806(+)
MWNGKYQAKIAQNILEWHWPVSKTFSSSLEFTHQSIKDTSIKGFTRLVITSATKNSKNLTSEIGEYKQWKVATIVGNLITLWNNRNGLKNTAINVINNM